MNLKLLLSEVLLDKGHNLRLPDNEDENDETERPEEGHAVRAENPRGDDRRRDKYVNEDL